MILLRRPNRVRVLEIREDRQCLAGEKIWENKMENLTSLEKEIDLHCLSYQIQIEERERERVPLEESPMLGGRSLC
jgi:hypothetical protein